MKTKPIILIAVTLIIGFILGMLTSAQLRFHRLQPVRLYFSETRFMEGFYKIIEPDEKQKAEIDKILDKYSRLNSTLQSNFRKELDVNMKEFRKEIDAKLTKEQLDKLKAMDDRRQQMIKENWKNRRDSSGQAPDRWGERNRRPRVDNRVFHGDRPPLPQQRPPMPEKDTLSGDK
jgi:hypothetical protein